MNHIYYSHILRQAIEYKKRSTCVTFLAYSIVALMSLTHSMPHDFVFQNIQSTSDKALRAGDAKTIAILVDSHHKSLQLISTHCSRLETISASLESSKADLTAYVHRRLKQLMEMQRKVKESNDQLRILHEQVKLARQRFQILQQVSSTPQVLVDVFGELGRRRSYSMALEKVGGRVNEAEN